MVISGSIPEVTLAGVGKRFRDGAVARKLAGMADILDGPVGPGIGLFVK